MIFSQLVNNAQAHYYIHHHHTVEPILTYDSICFPLPLHKHTVHHYNPASSGTLVNSIGFEWMLVGIAILCFLYAPLLTLLRAPPTKEEKKVSIGGIENGGLTLDNDKPVQTVLGGTGGGDTVSEPNSTQDLTHTRPATPIGNAAQESYTTKL